MANPDFLQFVRAYLVLKVDDFIKYTNQENIMIIVLRYIFLNQKIKVLLDVLNFGLYFFLSTKSCFLTMMRVPVDHAGHKSIVCPFSYLAGNNTG